MAKYTLELRELYTPIKFNPPLYTEEQIKGWFMDYNLSDYLTEDEIEVITDRGVWSKEKLAQKILDHYFLREIGFETPAMFKHYAKVEMQEIMEEYAPLIYSASIKYDPLVNVDFTESFSRTLDNSGESESSGESSSTSNTSASNLGVNSDTPQGQITKANILAGAYASSTGATESESEITDGTETSSSSSNSSNTEEEYTKKVKGNSGVSATAQKMILQYRENIIAIDRDIIKRLNILFMGLY